MEQTRLWSRRQALQAMGGALLGAGLPACAASVPQGPQLQHMYIGTYTYGSSEGIYRVALNLDSGALTLEGAFAGGKNPSYLAIDGRGSFLYAANEVSQFRGEKTGSISAFAIEPQGGALTPINQAPSGGTGPCFLTLDPGENFVGVANYGGGSTAVLRLEEGGALGALTAQVQHGPADKTRRSRRPPRPHGVVFDPQAPFVYVPDLGLDQIVIYTFDPAAGRLLPYGKTEVKTKAKAGPRHFVLHPEMELAFSVNELDSTLGYYQYQEGLKPLGAVSTLPKGFTGKNSGAAIHFHPNGRFVYTSNRGHDSIAAFAVVPKQGAMPLGYYSCGGSTPRSFAIDPTGRFLVVANQKSNTLVSLRIESGGGLAATGHSLEVPVPVCVKMMPA